MNARSTGVQLRDFAGPGGQRLRRLPQGPVGGAPARILVLESLRVRGHALRELLVQERFDVGLVEEVRTALHWLGGSREPAQGADPVLLICNARMLGEEGLALLARWREAHPHVPLLFLSAFENAKLRARLARFPRCLLLAQSFTPEDVCATAVSQVASYAVS